jgi:hypothetical protein
MAGNTGNFMAATRQNWLNIPTKTPELGGMTQFDLPKVGLFSKLFLLFTGTMTLDDLDTSANVALKDTMGSTPFGIIKELRIKINSGLTIVKIPGYHLFLHNLLKQRSQFPDVEGTSLDAGYANSRPYDFSVTSSNGGTANTWRFMLEVPIAINEKDPVGLLLLQTSDTVVTVEIDWAASTDMFTLANSATAVLSSASLKPVIEVFSVPVRKEDRPALDTVHALIYNDTPITAVGDLIASFERGNIYMRVINRGILNGSRAGLTDISTLQLRYNGNQYPYQSIDTDIMAAIQRSRYGRDLPQAVFVWDWFYQGVPGYGSARDWINSGALTEFEQIVTVASGATLGSNNNKLEMTREILIPVAMG